MTSAPVVPDTASSTASCGTSWKRGVRPRSWHSRRSSNAELRDAPSSAIASSCSQGTSLTSSTVRTAPWLAMAMPGTMRRSSWLVA